MSTDALTSALLRELANSDSDTEGDDLAASLLAVLTEGESYQVTKLAYGQTAKHPGYDSEAEYLRSQRRPTYTLGSRVERHSHRRWQPYPGTVGAILENKDRGWQGRAACRRQAARARAASLWYGVPNIILGS